jgi:hypothetical protein
LVAQEAVAQEAVAEAESRRWAKVLKPAPTMPMAPMTRAPLWWTLTQQLQWR